MSSATAPPELRDRTANERPAGDAPRPGGLRRGLSWLLAWSWRIAAGAFLCFNAYLLSYLTSILVVGWLNRWARGRILRGWWKQSPLHQRIPFEEFSASQGGDAVRRPRWVLPERPRTVPALWLNFKTGFVLLLCIYLVLGWGCALMTFGWEFGWVNSFGKGYEQALTGPVVVLSGMLLFSVAMFYVPMAQAHVAATGDYRAFFDVRVVWRLVQARLTAYVGLAVVIGLVALPLEVLKAAPAVLYDAAGWDRLDDAELLAHLHRYLQGTAVVLFLSLLLIHALSARVYGSAVLKALRRGRLTKADLHPRLAAWLEGLKLLPDPREPARGLVRVVRWSGRWCYRRLLYTLLLFVWLGFGAKVLAGEFFQHHPFVGFMNHPLLQFPCVEYIPEALQNASQS